MRANSTKRTRRGAADIYAVLLAIALFAIIIGCVFLYLETADYGSPPYPKGGVTVQAQPDVIAPPFWRSGTPSPVRTT
ncbi:hypothetical protein JCM19992_10010 [Thermostilla marina]